MKFSTNILDFAEECVGGTLVFSFCIFSKKNILLLFSIVGGTKG
jgi:hypothetical protein